MPRDRPSDTETGAASEDESLVARPLSTVLRHLDARDLGSLTIWYEEAGGERQKLQRRPAEADRYRLVRQRRRQSDLELLVVRDPGAADD